jgi:hypothetical protein
VSFYTPNFAVGSSWRNTIGMITSQLRKIKFAIDETFQFAEFDPKLDVGSAGWGGMTASAITILHARYLKLFKLVFFSIRINATLAIGGGWTNQILATLPESLIAYDPGSQAGGGAITLAGTYEAAIWQISASANQIRFIRNAGGNYSAGDWGWTYNGFIEVK